MIMGVYNCPSKEMLTRAIDSVLNQSFEDFEFLICDDGSTNDTLKWTKEKAEEDSRITVLENKENKGLAEALNKCLEKASGKLIARQDIDDYSMQDRFQTQVDFLNENKEISFVGSACYLYYIDENGKTEINGEWHRPELPTKEDFLYNSPFVHGTLMFRREVFEKCGGYRLIGRCRKYEDYDFFMRAYAKGFQGANIDRLLYTYYSDEKKSQVPARMRLDEYKVRKEGFRELGLMPKGIPYLMKPILLIFVPGSLQSRFKNLKNNKSKNKRSFLLRMYKILVNRNSYIKFNYERFTNTNRKLHRRFPVVSWCYLIKLNLESILLHRTERGHENAKGLKDQESFLLSTPEEVAKQLSEHEVVSFDIFDTLIFRPFASPTDLFYIVGEKLNYPDFKTVRTEAERAVRQNKGGESVNLKDIYDYISDRTGIDSESGRKTEEETELTLSIANPYMKSVFEEVKKNGRRIIVASDMYLSSDFMGKLLKKNGYDGYEKIYVSCEKGAGKHDGSLYDLIKQDLGTNDIAHIGDNYGSDVENARKHGLSSIEYKNVNSEGNIYRPKDMSPIIGSAYSGIVNRKLYSGVCKYSPAYEYGFKYGGLLILGFCGYIHKVATEKAADRILFFSRDGYIVKEIYDHLYSEESTEYVYWSRNAATKLGADMFRDNYIKRYVTQKTNHGISLYDIFNAMGIADWEFPFGLDDELTMKNAAQTEQFIYDNWDRLLETYKDMDTAARIYFSEKLKDCKNVVTVDCGWAGSGNIILDQLVNRKWGMHCKFTGVLAGSNSYNQHDYEYSETFFLDGKMLAYCFSSSLNRDKYMSHQPSANHNIYFEMLFSAPEPSFREFKLNDDGGYGFVFDNATENETYIEEIQKGEREFIQEYVETFREYPYMFNISGSDAYAPFMDAMQHSKKYIDRIFAECIFDETTNGNKEKIK